MTSTPSFSQTAYGWYEDGSESGSADAGIGVSTALDRYLDGNQFLHLRVRLQITNAVAGATTDDFQLQYAKNGGAFANVAAASSGVIGRVSSNLTDAATTTNRLGAGTGSFVAGEVANNTSGLVTDRQVTASNYSEMLYSIQLTAADLADGDVLTFRVLRNGATITYSVTPQVTVHVPAATLGNGFAISNRSNMLVTHKGGSVYEIVKQFGTNGSADADATSATSLTGDFVLRLKKLRAGPTGTNFYGGGVTTNPATDSSYTSINHAWLWFEGVNWFIYENGGQQGSGLADSTYSWIWRTGTTLGYGRGATLATAQASPDRTVTDSNTLGFDSSATAVGDRFEALLYFPANTFNDNLTESLTAGSTQSVVATFNPAQTESLTAAHSDNTTATFVATLSESVTPADSVPGGLLLSSSVTESITGADAFVSSQTFVASVSEGLAGGDGYGAGLVMSSVLSETATASDSISYVLTMNVALNATLTLVTSFVDSVPGAGARVTVFFLG